MCPICAVLPSSSGGDPNHLTEDLLHHIQFEHMNTDPLSGGGGGGAGSGSLMSNSVAAAARFSRRLNYATAAAAAANLSRSSAGQQASMSTGTSNLLYAATRRNHLSNAGVSNQAAPQPPTPNRFALQFSTGAANSGAAVAALPPPNPTGAPPQSASAGLSSFIRSATSAMENFGSGAVSNSSSAVNAAATSDPIVELLSQLTGMLFSYTLLFI